MAGLALLAVPPPALAESLVAARTIRALSVITAPDLAVSDATIPGALTEISDAVGLETRVAIYPGRPIRPEDLAPPAIIERNQIVPLVYRHGTLAISTEGRSLGRGTVGDRVRVMNLASRTTVSGIIGPDGHIWVETPGFPAARKSELQP
jgi:flagella basal body P-ring formation protein FlgA